MTMRVMSANEGGNNEDNECGRHSSNGSRKVGRVRRRR
jgi:hypothetical protein